MAPISIVHVCFKDGVTSDVPYRDISNVYRIKMDEWDFKIYKYDKDGDKVEIIIPRYNVRDIMIRDV